MPRSQFSRAYKILAAAIVDARRRSGLTQEDLAKRLGVPQSRISNMESGLRRVDLVELVWLADATGADLAAIVEAVSTVAREDK